MWDSPMKNKDNISSVKTEMWFLFYLLQVDCHKYYKLTANKYGSLSP